MRSRVRCRRAANGPLGVVAAAVAVLVGAVLVVLAVVALRGIGHLHDRPWCVVGVVVRGRTSSHLIQRFTCKVTRPSRQVLSIPLVRWWWCVRQVGKRCTSSVRWLFACHVGIVIRRRITEDLQQTSLTLVISVAMLDRSTSSRSRRVVVVALVDFDVAVPRDCCRVGAPYALTHNGDETNTHQPKHCHACDARPVAAVIRYAVAC